MMSHFEHNALFARLRNTLYCRNRSTFNKLETRRVDGEIIRCTKDVNLHLAALGDSNIHLHEYRPLASVKSYS